MQRATTWRGRPARGVKKSRGLVSALEEIADSYNTTPAQVALNWVIHSQGDGVVTIPGVTQAKQAQENAGAMKFKLSDADLARLSELSQSIQ